MANAHKRFCPPAQSAQTRSCAALHFSAPRCAHSLFIVLAAFILQNRLTTVSSRLAHVARFSLFYQPCYPRALRNGNFVRELSGTGTTGARWRGSPVRKRGRSSVVPFVAEHRYLARSQVSAAFWCRRPRHRLVRMVDLTCHGDDSFVMYCATSPARSPHYGCVNPQ